MADGVYEVTSVLGGKLIDFAGHCKRLARSLAELDMAAPVTDDELLAIHRELVAVNGMTDGMVYLQITRGAPGDRDFAFPNPATTPSTLVLFTQSKPGLAENPAAKTGMKVISIPDIRWGRRDIKTVQLLYPSMGKMMAKIQSMVLAKGPLAQSSRWFSHCSLLPKLSPLRTSSIMPFIRAPPMNSMKPANSTKTKRVVRSRDWANWPSSRARSSRRSVGSRFRSSLLSDPSANS
jgi:hypothetical protein